MPKKLLVSFQGEAIGKAAGFAEANRIMVDMLGKRYPDVDPWAGSFSFYMVQLMARAKADLGHELCVTETPSGYVIEPWELRP